MLLLRISMLTADIYYLSKAGPYRTKSFEVTAMKNEKAISAAYYAEQGTPFYTFTLEGHTGVPTVRVMPSGFGFPVLPAACTFIRDLGYDDGASRF